MAGIRFIDIVTDVENISQFTGQRAILKRLINQAVAKVASAWNWPFLYTHTFLSTVAEITAGDADVTNGSTSVTSDNGSTSWPATVVGRKFRLGSQRAYYTIATRVSATSITLDQPFQGSTDTDESYSIYQDEHLLRADVDYPKILRQIENGVPLLSLNASEFDLAFPTPSTMGDSTIETYLGRNVGTYETGTVALPASSRTLTGVSTAWTTARGVGRGTKIRISDAIFTVNTVDSDTQITLYEANGTTAVAAGTAYAAIIDNPIVLLHPIPDTVVNYYYRFQRIPAVMDRDGDIPDLPHALHHLLVEEAQVWAYIYKGLLDRATAARARYEADLVDAIRSFGQSNPDRTYRKHSFDEELRSVSSRHPILNAG